MCVQHVEGEGVHSSLELVGSLSYLTHHVDAVHVHNSVTTVDECEQMVLQFSPTGELRHELKQFGVLRR